MRTEDGYIIYRCLNGDSNAFGFLVDKYKAGVYAFAYERLHNFHDAEDIAQEVFFKAYKSLRTLRRWDSFASWLYRITLNLCRNWIRAQSSRPDREFTEDQDPEVLEAHSRNMHRQELAYESVGEALDSLPEMYSQALTLHYFGGMTSMEIARFTGVSPSAIRMRLRKARSLLKEEILAMMSTTYEQQRLQASFTFRILEAVKRMRIHPTPRTAGLPWGLSLATGIAITILSLSPHLSIPRSMASPTGSRLAGEMNAMEAGEIPVNLLLLDSKQGDGDSAESELSELHEAASVSATHSEGDTRTQGTVADKGSTIIDPETGIKFTKIFSDEKLDVIGDAIWMTVSPNGRFLFTPSGNWVVPLEEGEPFKLDEPPVAEMAGSNLFPSWSPDGSMISFLERPKGAIWVIPVSMETGRATGSARKLVGGLKDLIKITTWSPDGKMIAYAAEGDIWKIPVTGGAPEQITDNPLLEVEPAWSSDGSAIAFVRVRDEKRRLGDIWLISPEGKNAEKIIEWYACCVWDTERQGHIWRSARPDTGTAETMQASRWRQASTSTDLRLAISARPAR